MPKKRIYTRKPRTKKMNLTKKISSIVMRKAETKVCTTEYEGGASANNWCAVTPAVEYISGITQGTGAHERTGLTITPTLLEIRGMIRFFVNNTSSNIYWGNPVRVVVFAYDCSQDGAGVSSIPGFAEVTDTNPTVGTTQPPDYMLRPYANDNRLAYTILYDKTFANNGQGGNFTPFHIKISGKKLPKTITYTGATNSSANAGRNGLFIMYSSMFDKVPDVTGALFSYVANLKYKDM